MSLNLISGQQGLIEAEEQRQTDRQMDTTKPILPTPSLIIMETQSAGRSWTNVLKVSVTSRALSEHL